VEQAYLPENLEGESFFLATEQGMEEKMKQNQTLRKKPAK
jgi:putative ATPase